MRSQPYAMRFSFLSFIVCFNTVANTLHSSWTNVTASYDNEPPAKDQTGVLTCPVLTPQGVKRLYARGLFITLQVSGVPFLVSLHENEMTRVE
jgi:hypothetical protein